MNSGLIGSAWLRHGGGRSPCGAHAGLAGYFYRQVTGDSGSGAVLGDFKSQVLLGRPAGGLLLPRSAGRSST